MITNIYCLCKHDFKTGVQICLLYNKAKRGVSLWTHLGTITIALLKLFLRVTSIIDDIDVDFSGR